MALRTDFEPETSDFRGLSLCAGYAGLDLGLHIAEPRYRTVGFVEREAHAAATLVARMADQALDPAPIWDDLRSFDGRPWRGRVHLVAAGYPCQPFSSAGHRRGAADPRHLWPEVARIIREVRPRWVFLENVVGHLTLGLQAVIDELERMGFQVAAGVFSAEEAGGPHVRERLFVVAHADGVGCGLLPGPDDRGRQPKDLGAGGHRGGQLRPVCAQHRLEDLDGPVADHESPGVVGEDGDVPLFAPRPGQLQVWEDLLDRRPDLQPSLLRAGHGMADRLDRTKGVGNGVCSLAAALAWGVLKADLQLRS